MIIKTNYKEIEVYDAKYNLSPKELSDFAISLGEGVLGPKGEVIVKTGKYTGRSAEDKFIVDVPSVHSQIAWGKVNKAISADVFNALWIKTCEYIKTRQMFVFDGFGGADERYRKSFRVINELASQNLFIHQLLRRPSAEELENFAPDYTVLAVPSFKCDPAIDGVRSEAAIILDFDTRRVLIVGTGYAGEIKKSVFSVMNYELPKMGVLSMHCSANVGKNDIPAIFFGLSGTGKTTLSTDPNRQLIGDDEHGWSDEGIFNIEGGCYAKCINLSKEKEPDIYNAIRAGALVENVVYDEKTREYDFDDDSLAVNSRVGYPVEHINGAVLSGKSDAQPNTVIFLTADAYGVLPPISRLTNKQAMYYFALGFTSKLAGTEIGIKDPVPTFSSCFGEPFLPLPVSTYVNMLEEKLKKSGAQVYLVNTGWNGKSERIKLSYTRAMVTAAVEGKLKDAEYITEPIFGLAVPEKIESVPCEVLNQENSWEDKEAFKKTAEKLKASFDEQWEIVRTD